LPDSQGRTVWKKKKRERRAEIRARKGKGKKKRRSDGYAALALKLFLSSTNILDSICSGRLFEGKEEGEQRIHG